MQLKDYYKTLDVQPAASMLQIKKSFRQLAMVHHPDKNPGSAVAEATFKEIQEAYETLIDPAKREEYNYKRWYNKSIREPFIKESLTPAAILQECIHLNNYMHTVNELSVDFDGLSAHIRHLLNNKSIGILTEHNDEKINAAVVHKIIQSAAILPYNYTAPLVQLLLRVASDNEAMKRQVAAFSKRQMEKNYWNRYRVLLVVLVTLLLCWIIYAVSS